MRNHTADALKAGLIVLVIVGHIFLTSAEEDPVKGFIYLFHMPLFLALSGYFFSPRRSVPRELVHAWHRYLRPWLIATIVFFVLLTAAKGHAPFSLVEAFLQPWFHLWYIPALLIFSLTVVIFRRTGVVLAFWSVPLAAQWLGYAVDWRAIGIDPRYVDFGIFFAIGFASRSLFKRYSPRVLLWCLVPAVALVPFLFPHFTTGPLVDVTRMLLSLAFISAVAAWPGSPSVLSASAFSSESLAIYLYHPIPIFLLRVLEPRIGGTLYWAMSLVTCLVLVPYGIRLARRVPAFSWGLGLAPGGPSPK